MEYQYVPLQLVAGKLCEGTQLGKAQGDKSSMSDRSWQQ